MFNGFISKIGVSIPVLIIMLCVYIPGIVVDTSTFRFLEKEDGFYEYLGAFLFLLAAITFFYLYFSSKNPSKEKESQKKRNVFFLWLGIIFFMGFGEEISWGQRIFGYDNPDLFDEINVQHEFNIHNINVFHGTTESGSRKSNLLLLLNIDRLFSMFWVSFCLLIPLLAKFDFCLSSWMRKTHFPVVPLSIGYLFPVNYLISKLLDFCTHRNFVEIKETNFALLFFAVSYHLYREQKRVSHIEA